MVISSKKLVKSVGILLILLMFFVCASVALNVVPYSASALASDYDISTGTFLESGNGLQVGANAIRTDSAESGSESGTGEYKKGKDIAITNSTSYQMTSDALYLTNGTMTSKVYLATLASSDSINRTDAVGRAMLDTSMDVCLNFSATFANQGVANADIIITIKWGNESGEGSSYINNAKATEPYTYNLATNTTKDLSVSLENISNYNMANGATSNYFLVSVTTTTGSVVAINNLDLEITVDVPDMSLNKNNISCEVSGDNRATDTLTLSNQSQYTNLLKQLYIKSGDTIKVSAYATTASTGNYKFPNYYDAVFDMDWLGIAWINYGDDGRISFLEYIGETVEEKYTYKDITDAAGNVLYADSNGNQYSIKLTAEAFIDESGKEYEEVWTEDGNGSIVNTYVDADGNVAEDNSLISKCKKAEYTLVTSNPSNATVYTIYSISASKTLYFKNGVPCTTAEEELVLSFTKQQEVALITYLYTAEFTVAENVSNTTTITIAPQVYTSVSKDGVSASPVSTSSTQIELKVDAQAPSSVDLDTDKGLGATIAEGKWYTISKEIALSAGQITSLANYANAGFSAENLFAFVLPAGTTYGFVDSALADFDFSPNGDSYLSLSTSEGIYQASRQSIITWAFDYNKSVWVRTMSTCNFDVTGESSLLLVAVDTAGNVSTRHMYSSNEGEKGVFVDATAYSASLEYTIGSESSGDKSSSLKVYTQKFFIFAGDEFHNEAGELTYTPAEISKHGGITGPYAMTNVKRGEIVTLAILMDSSQAKLYEMINFKDSMGNPHYNTSGGDWEKYTDASGVGISKGYVLYVFKSFEMGGEGSGDLSSTKYTINFKKIVTIDTYGTDNITYSGNQFAFKLNEIKTTFKGNVIEKELNTFSTYVITYYEVIDLLVTRSGTAGDVAIHNDGTTHNSVANVFFESNGNYYMNNTFVIGDKTYEVASYNANPDGTYSAQAYVIGENYTNSAGLASGFTSAGTYIYRIEMQSYITDYTGYTTGVFTIKKAEPVIQDLASIPVSYGQSLEDVVFSSTDSNGKPITDSFSFDNNLYYSTVNGVYGIYSITSPAGNDENYLMPSVNNALQVTVKFTPINLSGLSQEVIESNLAFYGNYYEEVNGTYVMRADAPDASNYASVSLKTFVKINHKQIKDADVVGGTIDAEGNTIITDVVYDGTEKAVEIKSSIIDAELEFIIEYSGDNGVTFATNAPTNAGAYIIRYMPNMEKGNYSFGAIGSDTQYQYATMTIDKRSTNVVTNEEHTIKTPSTEYDGAFYQEKYVYTYGHISIPQLIATYLTVADEVEQMYPTYLYESKLMLDYNGEAVVDSSYSDMFGEDGLYQLGAGTYLLHIIIDNPNNKGEIIVVVEVKQQASNTSGGNMTVQYPSLESNYVIYNMDGSITKTNEDNTIGNIQYGQTIADMQSLLFDINKGYVSYEDKNGVVNQLSGRFYLQDEQSYAQEKGISFINPNFYDVLYNDSGMTLAYEIKFYWETGEYVNGQFVPNTNFDIVHSGVSLYVCRAITDFSEVQLSNLTYGETIADVEIQGLPSTVGGFIADAQVYKFGTDSAVDTLLTSTTYNDGTVLTAELLSNKTLVYATDSLGNVMYCLFYQNASTDVYEVGNNSVSYKFITSGEYSAHFCDINSVELELVVSKKDTVITFNNIVTEGDLSYITYAYGSVYASAQPTVVITIGGTEEVIELTVIYTYYDANGNVIVLDSQTPVGSYSAKATISADNYYGESTIALQVIKSDLSVTTNVTAQDIVYYGMTLDEVALPQGSVWVKNKNNPTMTIAGTISFVEWSESNNAYVPSNAVIDAVGAQDFMLMFSPSSDTTAYDSYNELYFALTIDVQKAIAPITLGDLTQTYDGLSTAITASATGLYQEDINLVITYTDSQGVVLSNPTDAGLYAVEVIVNEEFYQGTEYATLTINKAEATVSQKEQVYIYDGTVKNLLPEITVDIDKDADLALAYIVSYIDYRGNVVAEAMEIGKYTATVTVMEDNYSAVVAVVMYIVPQAPSITALENLNQEFNITGNKGVSATFDVEDVTYRMFYSAEGATADLVASYNASVVDTNWEGTSCYPQLASAPIENVVPTNAGLYATVIRVEYNGIAVDYIMDTDANSYLLSITKTIATITISESLVGGYIQKVYTGQAIENINYITSTPVNVAIYSKLESESEYTLGAPINAGKYDVKISVDDINYVGTVEAKMFVDKATPDIVMVPAISSTIAYGSIATTDIEFSDGGQVVFDGKPLEGGTWYINESPEYLATLLVGTHIVNVAYKPEDTANFYDATLLAVDGITEAYGVLNIVKNDISDLIVVDESKLTQSYTGYNIVVTASIADNDVIGAGYKDINLIIYYGGSTTPKINAGEYDVTVVVDDANYSGSLNNVKLVINKANLTIVAPNLSNIQSGDVLSTVTISGGSAYVALDGGLTQTIVTGSFKFNYPNTVMSSANWQEVSMKFTPDDMQNHNTSNFITEIFVVANTPEVSNVQIGSQDIYYGQPLSDVVLTCDQSVNGNGTIEWVTPNAVLNAGRHDVEYIFTPEDSINYNIVKGTIKVTIQKADLSCISDRIVAIAYAGGSIADALIDVEFWHKFNNSDATWIVTESLTRTINTNHSGDLVVGETIYATVTYKNSNYNELTINLDIKVLSKLTSNNFQIGAISKDYTGSAVAISDFDISIIGTDYKVTEDKLTFVAYQNGVQVSEVVDCGIYNIVVSIKNYEIVDGKVVFITDINYGGSTQFEFTVDKQDISDTISADNLTKYYGDYLTVVKASSTLGINAKDFVYSFVGADGTNYGTSQPQNAGVYTVTVSIAQSNSTYKAHAQFEYTILKTEVEIGLEPSYTFAYGDTINIIPQISNNITTSSYTITYVDKNGYESLIVPQNAGVYTIIVTVIHNDFVGSAKSVLTINKTPVTLQVAPTVSAITYGQTLDNSTITGGIVVYGTDAQQVEGTFSFVKADSKFDAGVQSVELQFTPKNQSNFMTLTGINVTITIEKAVASITMTESTSTMVYTGSALAPTFVTGPETGIALAISYKQGTSNVTPINVGIYSVFVSIVSTNYTSNGVQEFTFSIVQAKGSVTKNPETTQITYGSSLNEATIIGGEVTYVIGNTTVVVPGTFSFLSSEELGNVGIYNNISYVFTPTGYGGDSNASNYSLVYGTTTVEVVKAKVVLSVSNIKFEYGTTVPTPTITFDTVDSLNVTFTYNDKDIIGQIVDVGTYSYTVAVAEEVQNYYGSLSFNIEVYKKELVVKFVDAMSKQEVTKYTTSYNIGLDVDALIASGIVTDSESESIESLFRYYFVNKNGNASPLTPTDVGEYEVYATLNHKNYYVDSDRVMLSYDIERGTIQQIYFESKSLSSQVYGSVTAPIVVSVPSDVKYEISYPGFTSMPTSAGSYSVTVLVTDSNYNPVEVTSIFRIAQKEITIEDIVVENKVADGTSLLTTVGKLVGLEPRNEVYLSMTAQTVGGVVTAGTHNVELLTWEISGLHASNYIVRKPVYPYTVKIKSINIKDKNSGCYATSSSGFSQTVTIEVNQIESAQNQSNFLSTMFGTSAVVQSIIVKDQGVESVLKEQLKFYVKIPDEFLDSENLKVEALGALSQETIVFTREGDYITFYADKSGQVVFHSTDFPYWTIIIIAVVILFVVGGIFIRLYRPIRKRKTISRRVRKEFKKANKQ